VKTVSNSILDFYRETKEKNGKKSHPFISAEKRFSLTKSFLNGNDYEFTHKMPSKKSYCKDNLSGGIAKFINVNKRKDYSKELFIKKYKKDYYKIRKKFIDDYNKIDFTKRVILPQKNIEKPPPKKMKIITEAGKNLRRLGEGSYLSLIARTPVSFPVKGRKRVNKSFDCGNKPDSEIFFENKIEECMKDNNRLFGVERKFRTKLINIESEDPPYKFGRKHFYGKIKDSILF